MAYGYTLSVRLAVSRGWAAVLIQPGLYQQNTWHKHTVVTLLNEYVSKQWGFNTLSTAHGHLSTIKRCHE